MRSESRCHSQLVKFTAELLPQVCLPFTLLVKAPKWAMDVKFILVDVEPSQRDSDLAAVVLVGDASLALESLLRDLIEGGKMQLDRCASACCLSGTLLKSDVHECV